MKLEDCRRFYAEEVRYAAHLTSPALIDAFASVPREEFLGPGPWKIGSPEIGCCGSGISYSETEDADPSRLYHNITVAIDPVRRLNNGQPSALAFWIGSLDLKPGDRVFHLGCGVGYYTAILAHVVGAKGSVIACEVDPELAARAAANLSAYPSVTVHAADGKTVDPGPCDALLINAGVTHPHLPWLDRMPVGGRMVLPITIPMPFPGMGKGIMVKVTRQPQPTDSDAGRFSVQTLSFVAIYSCTSLRDTKIEPDLGKALASGALMKVRSLRRDNHKKEETCVLHGKKACLSTAEVNSPAAVSREPTS